MLAVETYIHYDFRNYLGSIGAIDPEATGDFDKYKNRILLRYVSNFEYKKQNSVMSGNFEEADKFYGIMSGQEYKETYKRIWEQNISFMKNAGLDRGNGFISSLSSKISKIKNVNIVVKEIENFLMDLDQKMEAMWKLAKKSGTWDEFQKSAVLSFVAQNKLSSSGDKRYAEFVFNNIKKKTKDGFFYLNGNTGELDNSFGNIALLAASLRNPPGGDYGAYLSDLTAHEGGETFKKIADKIAGYVSYMQGEAGEIADSIAAIQTNEIMGEKLMGLDKFVAQVAKVGSKKINSFSGAYVDSVTFEPDESFMKQFQELKSAKNSAKKIQGKTDVMAQIETDKVVFAFGINVKNYTLLPGMMERKINFGEMSFAEALSNIGDFLENERFTGYISNVAMGRISSRFDDKFWSDRRSGKTSSTSDLTRRWNNIVNLFGYSVLDKAISGDYMTRTTESLFVSVNGNIYPLNEIYSFILSGDIVPVFRTNIKREDIMRTNVWHGGRKASQEEADFRQKDVMPALNDKLGAAKLKIALRFPRALIG